MPRRTEAPSGSPCWVDLFSSDTDAARSFYGGLLGWAAEEGGEEYGGYITFRMGEDAVAGLMANDGSQGIPDGWNVYLAVPDMAAATAAVEAHGGRVLSGPQDVVDLGTFAIVADPSGAVVGMWQAAAHPGFTLLFQPGAASWFELQTRDHDGSVQFYREVFGWDVEALSDTPGTRYTALRNPEGGGFLAGIMEASAFLPEGVPDHWTVYLGTADLDAAVGKVEELGGAVLAPVEHTPYGRVGTVADATGAAFRLVQPTGDPGPG